MKIFKVCSAAIFFRNMVGGTDFSGFWLVGSTDGVAGPESAHAPHSADSLATADYQGGGVDKGAGGGGTGAGW